MKTKYNVLSYLSKQKLMKFILKVPGEKDIIIDSDIIKPLENIIGFSELRSLNVNKIYNLQNLDVPLNSNRQQVFLIFSSLISVKLVCDHINSEICRNSINVTATKPPNYSIILVPKKLYSLLQLIEQEGVYEYVTIYSFPWELIPIDNHILSLEFPNFFNNLFTNRDQSLLSAVADSICSAFLIFGQPSSSIVIGEYSKSVNNMLEYYSSRKFNDHSSSASHKNNREIDYFILVDRDVDYYSTLLTPSTYTGLLDEVFEIQSGFIKLNNDMRTSLCSGAANSGSYEEVYSEIRNQYFSDAIAFLKTKAKVVQSQYNRAKNMMKLGEIKSYIKNELPNATNIKKSLSFHITACEQIVEKLGSCFEKFKTTEDSIVNNYSKREIISSIETYLAMKLGDTFSVLRLMCLLSLANNGLSSDVFHSLKSQFLHAYGYHYTTLFYNLEKNRLFFPSANAAALLSNNLSSDISVNTLTSRLTQAMSISLMKNPSSESAVQKLKLLSGIKETDINYVFNKCFNPAVPQIVSLIIKNEIQVTELSKIYPSAMVKTDKTMPTTTNPQTFFVFFVGGVTYAEIAAFQLLEKITGCQIIVAATNTINGNKLCRWNM